MSELRGTFGASAYGGPGCALWNRGLGGPGGPEALTRAREGLRVAPGAGARERHIVKAPFSHRAKCLDTFGTRQRMHQ